MTRLYKILILLTIISLSAIPSMGQSGQTSVTGTIQDSNGTLYINSPYTVTFYDPGTSGKLPLLNGSTFQRSYSGLATNSSGVLSISLPDNNIIASTSGATGTQWTFSICTAAATYTTIFCIPPVTLTITGGTQDISAAITAVAPLLPTTLSNPYIANGHYTGNNTFKSINNILYVGSAAGQYLTLQAAHDALPTTGGTIKLSSGYVDFETTTVNITKNDVSIICDNQPTFTNTVNTVIVFNHGLVGINVTGQNFGMDGCHLRTGGGANRINVPMIDSNTTSGGRLSNIQVACNGGSPNNGIFFRSTDAIVRQGIWQLDNIINRDGCTWTSLITVSIASNTLTGAYYKFTDIVNSYGEKYTDAAIVLDGTIDTVEMDRISTGNTQTNGHNIWIRNTVSASGLGYPRWIHCDNCYLEAGGNIGGVSLQIDSGRDIDYQGYIASSTNCINVTNSFLGVNIHDVAFTNIFGTCIAVTGGTGTVIHHSNFSDLQQGDITYSGGGGILIDGDVFRNDSQQITNTYDTITLAAGTGTASIMNCIWINAGANKPRYGINFLGNFNSSNLSGNIYAGVTFGTAFLNPPANNSNISVIGQDSTVTNKLTGPLVINNGSPINLYKVVTDTPGAITINTLTCTDRAVALAGSGTGAIIGIAANYALDANIILSPAQVVAGTLHYRLCNFTAANITLNAAAAFNLMVLQ